MSHFKSKRCFKCKKVKRIIHFYRHPGMKDGRLNKCKLCARADVSGNYFKNIDHYKMYEAKRLDLPHRIALRKKIKASKEQETRHRKNYRKKYVEKYRATNAVARALANGYIERPNKCSKCGIKCTPNGHHHDYSKKLDVIWLCDKCHGFEHRKIKLTENRFII